MPTFDLRNEPWIPVIRQDGMTHEVNLRTALLEAHEIRSISDALPIVEFGLYRLLTALVLDIFELADTRDLKALLAGGTFDRQRIDAYFNEHTDRFDLFHDKHPFLQTAGMETETAKPLAGLLPAIPSGINVSHFHHKHEDDFGVCPAVAARLLTTIAPFMTAGGAGLSPSINGAPPWYVLLSRPGSSLFETLCLNSCVLHLPLATPNHPPAWRTKRPAEKADHTEASLLQSLTWQPRRIQLVAGASGPCALTGATSQVLVRRMKFTAGAACRLVWRDPSVAYKIDDDGVTPLRPSEGREVWRDTGPLALLRETEYEAPQRHERFERPALITQYNELFGHNRRSRPKLKLTLYGMRTDLKMKVFEWQREDLSLPEELIWNSYFHTMAQKAIEQADTVSVRLQKAIKHAYPREGKGNKNAFNTRIEEAQRLFWSSLRSDYDAFLEEIALLSPEDDRQQIATCSSRWQRRLQHIGTETLAEAIGDLDTDADALKRQIDASRFFRASLSKLFSLEPSTSKKQSLHQLPDEAHASINMLKSKGAEL